MNIKTITIKNFQSYYGIQSIEFSMGLNLIIGNGGKGKSKLFNAFYWVLFGDIYITDLGWRSTDGFPHNNKFAMNRQDFLNRKALYETDVNEDVSTHVHLELEDEKGVLYEIERSVTAKRLDSENWLSPEAWNVGNSIIKVTYETSRGTQVRTDMMAEQVLRSLFPEEIRNYIWFQGESLDSLINFRDKATLKAAVKHISYYPYYEKVSAIITNAKAKIEKLERARIGDNNKTNKEINATLAKIQLYQNTVETEEKAKSNIELNITKIEMALAEDEGKMKGLANFTKLVNDYNKCKADTKDVMNKLTELDDYQRIQIPNLWILRGFSNEINICDDIINKHNEVQDTVPEKKYLDNPGRSKLEEIIKNKTCFVCGSDASEGTDAYNWVLKRIEEQEVYLKEMEDYSNNLEFSKKFERFVGSIQDYPNLLRISLDSIDKQFMESDEKMEQLQAQYRMLLKKQSTLDEQLEEIKKKHGVNPIEQVGQGDLVDNRIKASRSNLAREHRRLEASKEALANAKSELKLAEKDLERIGKKTGTTTVSETEWKNISIFLEDIFKRVQENARKDLLSKIEIRANEFYQKFTEHDNGYKGEVKINADYTIEFDGGLNTSHHDRKKMSIINAMLSLNQEALDTYYPFISDAPSSNFDIPTTHKYLLGVKDIFKQSIIITKDVDIENSNFEELTSQSKISRIYLLDSNVYCESDKNPDLHEVSTKVIQLK
ncbi:DNA sulfur modification protein DndD [Pedobacter suwonensis]|uniref:DNA sulfur modification protein DndD n=1 Tax=Pedobacter suwonensis TaxID=332999 RepID=A0A1I0U3E7_9SPHI|nr:AAA family ATPase [Pedobacter suwonensis]SFA58582.1 DNA sulfur modification protein DndD [Pedobacter suwonensis]